MIGEAWIEDLKVNRIDPVSAVKKIINEGTLQ